MRVLVYSPAAPVAVRAGVAPPRPPPVPGGGGGDDDGAAAAGDGSYATGEFEGDAAGGYGDAGGYGGDDGGDGTGEFVGEEGDAAETWPVVDETTGVGAWETLAVTGACAVCARVRVSDGSCVSAHVATCMGTEVNEEEEAAREAAAEGACAAFTSLAHVGL